MILHERVVLRDAIVEIELHADQRYRLRYGDRVEYTNDRRKVRGRTTRYEFRSVEQPRHDFERDWEPLG